MNSTYSDREHTRKRAKAELVRVNRELKQLRTQLVALEEQRDRLLAELKE